MANERVRTIQDILTVSDNITRPADTTQYSSGDAISAATSNEPFILVVDPTAGDRRVKARSGRIVKVSILSSAYVATGPGINLLMFNAIPAETADNSTVAITDAEMLDCIGVLTFTTTGWAGRGNQIQFAYPDIPIKLPLVDGGFTLWCQAVDTSGYIPTSAEIFTLTMDIELH